MRSLRLLLSPIQRTPGERRSDGLCRHQYHRAGRHTRRRLEVSPAGRRQEDLLGERVDAFKTGAHLDVAGVEVFVDLQDFINVDAEITRLTKEIERLEKAIHAKEKKLANEKFVARAPAEVVRKERDSLAETQVKLQAARDGLDGLSK